MVFSVFFLNFTYIIDNIVAKLYFCRCLKPFEARTSSIEVTESKFPLSVEFRHFVLVLLWDM